MERAIHKLIDVFETGDETLLHPEHPLVKQSDAFDAEHGTVYAKCRECAGTIRLDKDGKFFEHYLPGNYPCKGSHTNP